MTILSCLSLFGAMLLLAALPSSSVALVVSRSSTHGFLNGLAVAAGIVVGDLIFILIALLGMSFMANSLGELFSIIRFAGAAYLIYLGISLLRPNNRTAKAHTKKTKSIPASFLSGLFLTLGDLKAIIFYASFFPAFVPLDTIDGTDILLISLITIVAVGGTKTFYAYSTDKIITHLNKPQQTNILNPLAGSCLILIGLFLAIN